MRSFLSDLESRFIDADLHIWFGVITIIAGSFMIWMLNEQTHRIIELRQENVALKEQMLIRDSEISFLKDRLSMNLVPPVNSVIEVKPFEKNLQSNTVELKKKIDVVQGKIIDNNKPSTKVITKQEVVNKAISTPADKELKHMMLESYCRSAGKVEDICKGLK